MWRPWFKDCFITRWSGTHWIEKHWGFEWVLQTCSVKKKILLSAKRTRQTLNKLWLCRDKIDIDSCNTQTGTIDISYLKNPTDILCGFAYWESKPISFFPREPVWPKNECSVIIYLPSCVKLVWLSFFCVCKHTVILWKTLEYSVQAIWITFKTLHHCFALDCKFEKMNGKEEKKYLFLLWG